MTIVTCCFQFKLFAVKFNKNIVQIILGSILHKYGQMTFSLNIWMRSFLDLTHYVPTPQSRLLPENCLSVFDHFMRLVLKGLMCFLPHEKLIRCYWEKWITNGQRDWRLIIASSAKGEYPKNLPKPIPGQTFTGLSDLTQRK